MKYLVLIIWLVCYGLLGEYLASSGIITDQVGYILYGHINGTISLCILLLGGK